MIRNQLETVTICIPFLNEREVVSNVIEEWTEILDKLPKGSKLLIEDGGSLDGTTQVLKEYSVNDKRIEVIYRESPDGFGQSAKRLLGAAENSWVFFTDGDGQYVANDFWKLWERKANKDFVRGIKLGRKDPFPRRIASLIWNKCVNFLFELPVSDINAAFLLVRKESLRQTLPHVRFLKTMVLSELVIRLILANSRFDKDIYVLHRSRKNGKSRATPGIKFLLIGASQVRGLFRIKTDLRIEKNI